MIGGGIQSSIFQCCSSLKGSPTTEPPHTVDPAPSAIIVLALEWKDSAAWTKSLKLREIRSLSSPISDEGGSASVRAWSAISTLPIWDLSPVRTRASDSCEVLLFSSKQLWWWSVTLWDVFQCASGLHIDHLQRALHRTVVWVNLLLERSNIPHPHI